MPRAAIRFRLRPAGAQDIDALVEGLNDWTVAQWLCAPPYPYTRDDAVQFIESSTRSNPPSAHVIADAASDALMGVVGLEDKGGAVELGYWLLPRYHRKGLIRQSVLRLLDERTLPPSTLFALVDPENAPSIAVLRELGFTLEGRCKRDQPTRRGSSYVLRFEAG